MEKPRRDEVKRTPDLNLETTKTYSKYALTSRSKIFFVRLGYVSKTFLLVDFPQYTNG